ncbi:MAG: MBL fold metallo-hydrolase [Acidobacteriota bacterium]
MKVTFLGSGTSLGVPVVGCDCEVCHSEDPRDRRSRSSVALHLGDRRVLIDTTPDLRAQALACNLNRVDAVLYTHTHADHIFGLDDLRIYSLRQGEAIPLYGPAATLEKLRRTFWYAFEDAPTGGTKPQVSLIEVDKQIELFGATFQTVPVWHHQDLIVGYRVGAFAYLTDVSRIPDESRPLLEDLDVLVLNALRRRPHPSHLHLSAAVEEAQRIGARRTFFTHISDDLHHATTEADLPSEVRLAYDGLTLEIDSRKG